MGADLTGTVTSETRKNGPCTSIVSPIKFLGLGSEAVLPAPSNNLTAPGFNNTELLALLSTRQTNPISEDTIISSADNFLLDTAQEKLHFPYYSEDYHWGSNSALTNRAILFSARPIN